MPRNKSLDDLIAVLNQKFTPEGSERQVIQRGADLSPIEFIPCESPALGYVLNTGGWPKGKLVELFGKEAAGKSTLMLSALKDCYEYHDGRKGIAVIDIEHRYNEAWARLLGLPVDDMIVVQPPDAEKATDVMQHLLKSQQLCAIGFDSIGAVQTYKEHESFEDRENVLAGAARPMTRNVKTMAPLANLYGVLCVYTNQLRADMQGYNRPTTTGGHAVKHLMSVRLYIRPGKDKYEVKTSDGPKEVGYPMVFKAVKNSFGPRNREGYADFYWEPSHWYQGVGFNVEADLLRLGSLVGLIERAGPYYSWGDFKERGRDRFFETVEKAHKKEELLAAIRNSLIEAHQSMNAREEGIIAVGPEIEDDEV